MSRSSERGPSAWTGLHQGPPRRALHAGLRQPSWDLSALVPMMRSAGLVAGGVAGLTCIVAGLYMLSWTSKAEAEHSGMFGGTTNFFSVLKTGLGIYFCGKGLGIWAMTLFAFGLTQPKA